MLIAGECAFAQDHLATGFNHLTDISMDACKAKVKDWYNGFRFHAKSPTVYNPVSIAKFFEQGGKFRNYWFSTGTPTFLPEIMKHENFDLQEVITQPVSQFAFFPCEVERLSLWTLLLQQGYLTAKHAEPYHNELVFFLRVPNREAESVFQSLGLE